MSRHDFQIPVVFQHRIVFTHHAFNPDNPELARILHEGNGRRAIVFLESNVAKAWPSLHQAIPGYFKNLHTSCQAIIELPGGESAKADPTLVQQAWQAIDAHHIDRHSFVLAIGGGAFLDAVGLAAATAHRGIRLVRFPTTTLAQDDSGVGVKCAINGFHKKNWIGAFHVPFAVINDLAFLTTQPPNDNRAGLIEAIKVALVKDREFFEWIENHAANLANLETPYLEECVTRSALLHAQHIATCGDPFETGSSRPLDFGHWAAHKLESLTNYTLPHAPAVAIGVALDTLYSALSGLLPTPTANRILDVLHALRLTTYHPALDWTNPNGERCVLDGIDEFREHLGGELTILLLTDLGSGTEVHHLDPTTVGHCIARLRPH